MDPFTASTAFATIVGLICNFKQERKDQKDLKTQDFLIWLDEHRHQELKDYISHTVQLSSEIDKLLKEDTETILSKLDAISDVLASLVSQIDGLSGIAHTIRPQSELSDQAISILRQLVNSSSEGFACIFEGGGNPTLSLDFGANMIYDEPRFLQDDLATLVNFGLLQPRIGSSNVHNYGVTRNAVKIIAAIDGKNSNKS